MNALSLLAEEAVEQPVIPYRERQKTLLRGSKKAWLLVAISSLFHIEAAEKMLEARAAKRAGTGIFRRWQTQLPTPNLVHTSWCAICGA
jgi:hypothetical protein